MKKRFFCIALALCMLFALMPVSVFAAETYELYINDFRFSSTNLTYTSGSGSATYNPSSKTLTIKNLSLSTKGANTLIQSGIPGLTIKIDGTLTLNLLASKVEGGTDLGKARTNYGIAVTADTTICGANNSADKDSIIIKSQSVGVDNTEYVDGTTRVGIRPISGAKLTMKNLTVSMTDNSTGSYAGHASMIRAVNALNISGCKLVADKCQFGIFVDAYAPVTITDTVFSMALNGTLSSGVNLAPNAVNVMQNCSGSISAEYPIYTAGQLTISGGSKLTLVAGKRGIISGQNQNETPGKLIIDNNANLEIQSEELGLSAELGGSITMKSGTVSVTKATYGVQVTEDSSFAMQGGTLSIRGADTTSSVGIKNKGTVTVTGGSLKTENVYTAIQNDSGTALSISGGEHTLTAATCGYLGDAESELKISNTAKVTVNAELGIQLPASSGSKLTVSGGELNINATVRGIELVDSTSAMTLSGGKVNVTDKNSTPTIYGMYCRGNTQFTGAEVTFNNCKSDLLVANSASKMTGGKLHLSGSYLGAQFGFSFEMTGGEIDGSTGTFGIVVSQGTTTLKGGTVNMTASYPFYLTNGSTVDFAGANVTGNAKANCGLFIDPNTENNSYKISGGTVVLTSTQAGTNELYTSIPSNYGVWAGADEDGATLVDTPTQPILATSKYVRFAEKKAVTLTLVDVKEGTSVSYLPGTSFTYTAKDAPSGKHFSHWELTVNGSTTNVGTGTTYSGKMPAFNATLTAVYENCSGGTATCQAKAKCSVCGKEYGILAVHSFTAEVVDSQYAVTAVTCENDGVYYKSCPICGASSENWNNATFTVSALGHAWGQWESNGDGTHSRICSHDDSHKETAYCHGGTAECSYRAICVDCHGEYGDPGDHDFSAEVAEDEYLKDAATCTEAAVYYKSCSRCGASSKNGNNATFTVPTAGHTDSGWQSDAAGHWKVCTVCGVTTVVKADHTPDHEGNATEQYPILCTECGWEIEAQLSHTHSMMWVEAVEPTCTANGNIEHYRCSGCGKLFENATGSVELTAEAVVKRATGHQYEWVIDKEPTETEKGSKHEECTVCHDKKPAVEIPATGPVDNTAELQALLDTGGTVKLEKDYIITSTLNVYDTVILDLNGHVIKMTGNDTVIWVHNGGNLTLQDSNPTATHTGENASLPVGGVLTGGNAIQYGDYMAGGVGVSPVASFTMNGGTINNCSATSNGGGVWTYGSFTMNGGTISNCNAKNGGGVFNKGSFTMNGGSIVDCTASSADGVYNESGAVMHANGGEIKETVRNYWATIESTNPDDGTRFYGVVKNSGTISGGIYYGGIEEMQGGSVSDTYHTVSFDLNGGSGSAPTQWVFNISTATALRPADPTMDGHTFTGWYTDEALTKLYDFESAVSESITLYAGFKPVTYTVQYDGGAEFGLMVDFKTHGVDLTLAGKTFYRDGYVQSGWTDANGGFYDLGGTYSADADVTLYPAWDKIVTLTVPFTITVTLGDNGVPGETAFTLEIVDANAGEETYADVSVSAAVTTNGAGSYTGTMTLTGPYGQLRNMLCEGAFVQQVNGGADGWAYDDTVWGLLLTEAAAYASADDAAQEYTVLILPATCEETENGMYYELDWNANPLNQMSFTNVYTAHDHVYTQKHNETDHWEECACGSQQNKEAHKYGEWTVTKEATETAKGEKKHTCTVCGYQETAEIPKLPANPATGDNSNLVLWFALLALSAAGVIGTALYSKRRRSTQA